MFVDSSSAVIAIVSSILGGGFATAIYNIYRARIESKKAPVERFSIVAEGAEKAVTSLAKALQEADQRLTEMRTELQDERLRAQAGEARLRRFQEHLENIEQVVYDLRGTCSHMEAVLVAVREARSDLVKEQQ